MAIYHRKLLQEPDSNQTIDCSSCGPTCPYDCDYVAIYWPPQPPPPSTTNNDSSTAHVSPYVIVIVALIATAVLFISYYVIMKRYCTRFRQPFATQVNDESQDFMNEEIDHPIWYINTIGLQPAVIRSIAVVKFKKGESLLDVTDCSVCLSEFEDDESLRLLPKCNHAFHISCIDTWLRSHTNCPLCRAAVLSNNSNTPSQWNDQNIQMETTENDHGELGSDQVQEIGIQEIGVEIEIEDGSKETQDSKTKTETMISRLRRSFSMDSAAGIVHTVLNSSNSTVEMHSSSHIRDSRTRGMLPMRSFSYGGRSIV